MELKSGFDTLTQHFMRAIEQAGILNIWLFILFSSVISGIFFGTFEFIERSYATHYVLDIGSKLHGLVFSISWLTIYCVALGIIISLIVTFLISLMIEYRNFLEKRNLSISLLWLAPAFVLALLTTIIVWYFYFADVSSGFTVFFLFNSMIKAAILYKFYFLISLIFAGYIALFVRYKKGYNLIKTFLISLSLILVILFLLNIFTGLGKEITGIVENNYEKFYFFNSDHPVLMFAFILAIFSLIYSCLIYPLIIILPELWKYRLFKGFLVIYFPVASFGFYLFTVNYLVGQTFYVAPIGEIHAYTGVVSLLILTVSVILILTLINLTPARLKDINIKYTGTGIIVILLILMVLRIYIEPQSNRLKAFNHKALILQQHLSANLFDIKPHKNEEKFYTPAYNDKKSIQKCGIDYIKEKKTPNIFLISIDSLRTDYALNKKLAPNINKFLDNSYFLINNYSPATHTPASMSSIAISRAFSEPNDALPPSLASILSQSGYNTAAVVAMNLANPKLIMHNTYINDKLLPSPILKGYDSIYLAKSEEEQVDLYMLNRARELLFEWKRVKEPYMIWFHLYQLHETPVNFVLRSMLSRQPFINEYSRRLRVSDDLFEDYIKYLKQHDLYDNSLIILFADHGEEIKEHGSFFHTFSLYNELVKVPMAIKLPEQKSGEVIYTPTSTLDLAPTVLDYIGRDTADCDFSGESLLPVITGKSKKHLLPVMAFYRGFYYRNKLAEKIPGSVLMHKNPRKYYVKELYKYAIVDDENKWKLIASLTPSYYELYNLKTDPNETNNLADSKPDIVENLKTELDDWLTINQN